LLLGLAASQVLTKDVKIREEKAGIITSLRKEFLDDY